MSRRANPSIIGAFVLGGVALFVLAVGLFGSGSFGARKDTFVCLFEDSVNGLDEGAPVNFRGVTVGKVAEVMLRTDGQDAADNAVSVLIEVDERRLFSRGYTGSLADLTNREAIRASGLRARLQQRSLITGVLYVDLDFHPGTPARYHLPATAGGPVEIPTMASNFGTLARAVTQTAEQLGRIPFAALGAKADRILGQLEQGVGALDFPAINKAAIEVAGAANALLSDPQTRRIPENLNSALVAGRDLARHLDGQVTPTSEELARTAAVARETLEKIGTAAEALALLASPGAGLRANLDETLRQIADAARAVKSLANYLERRPNVIILGKGHAERVKNNAEK